MSISLFISGVTGKLGKVIAIPNRIQIPETIKEQLIVELYSK